MIGSRSSERTEKVTDEGILRKNIRARLEEKSAAAETTEGDEWDPEWVEDWNPADEARQAKRLDSWRTSQTQEHRAENSKITDSHSVFRAYENPQKPK